jgi:putative glutamine amidotransferase
MSRPIIAIGGTYGQAPPTSAFPTLRRIFTNEGYVSKLEQSGASVILIPNTETNIDTLISLCDGLLLPGGPDIEPSLYHQERHPSCGKSDVESDTFQIALYHAAKKLGKPIMGICRGCQLINVAEGGTLFQDYMMRENHLIDHPDLAHFDKVSHLVTIQENTRLASILGSGEVGVNSLHHQCIDVLAPDFQCMARSNDGCIEAIECTTGHWVLAVQWHPESMDEGMLPLFKAFVEEARKRLSPV